MSDSPFTESWLSGPQGTQFFTRTYRPSCPVKAAVVFVHGFAEHVARYEHVFPTWSSRGIAVFAYDQRGFGRTALDEQNKSKHSSYAKTSWKEQLEDIEWAIQHTKQQFTGVPVFLYGHSMVSFASLFVQLCKRTCRTWLFRGARWSSRFLLARRGPLPRKACQASPGSFLPARLSCRLSPLLKPLGGLGAKLVESPLPS